MIILSDDYRNDKSGENNDKFFSESNEIDDFFAQFDEIAEGDKKWTDVMEHFYEGFHPLVEDTFSFWIVSSSEQAAIKDNATKAVPASK